MLLPESANRVCFCYCQFCQFCQYSFLLSAWVCIVCVLPRCVQPSILRTENKFAHFDFFFLSSSRIPPECLVLRLAGVPLPASAASHLSSGTLRFFSRTREGIQIHMNDDLRTLLSTRLRTLLSTRLSLVSLRCSRLDTGETRIHIKGFLRAHLRRCNLLDAGGI